MVGGPLHPVACRQSSAQLKGSVVWKQALVKLGCGCGARAGVAAPPRGQAPVAQRQGEGPAEPAPLGGGVLGWPGPSVAGTSSC